MPADFVIIVPARGGSKRVKNKNMTPLLGKPLLHYTLELLHEADLHAWSYVSTDDLMVAEAARFFRMHVIDRPADLASDLASTDAVLLHALTLLATQGKHPTWVITMPPTCPLRTMATLRRFLAMLETVPPACDSVMSVTEIAADFWRAGDGETVTRVFPSAARSQQKRREDGDVLFEENGAFYASRVSSLREGFLKRIPAPILGTCVHRFTIDVAEAIDINTLHDVMLAETLLRHSSASDSPTS